MNADDRLTFWGVFLFFLSLLTGLLLVASPSFVANPRGVLAAHLEGALNGMFVTIVSLFFHRLGRSAPTAAWCRPSSPAWSARRSRCSSQSCSS